MVLRQLKLIDRINILFGGKRDIMEEFIMDDYVNVGRCFSILHRRSRLFVEEACQELNLTFSEYSILMRIYSNEGVKQDDLANMLYLDKAVVTRTINLLQEKKLIYRQQGQNDRRVRHIYLTEYGRQQYDFLCSIVKAWVDYLVADMEPELVNKLFQGFNALSERACKADLVKLANKLPIGDAADEKK